MSFGMDTMRRLWPVSVVICYAGYGKTMDIECGSDGCDNSLFECEPIRVPDTDHVFTAHSNKCLEFVRSEDTPNLDCKMGRAMSFF